MPLETVPFDAAAFLTDGGSQAELLDDALQSGDAAYIGEALAVISRARSSSLGREAAFATSDDAQPRPDDDPRLSTLLKVVRDLGARLRVQTVTAE